MRLPFNPQPKQGLPRRRGLGRARRSPNDFPPDVHARIMGRSGGRCEARVSIACNGRAAHAHHRQPRELGDQSEENGLAVCWVCHAFIHATGQRAKMLVRGLLVSRYRRAADVPVIPGPV